MSREFEKLTETFGYTLDDMQWFTVNAMKSAFIPFDERLAMISDVIKPGYAELKSEWLFEQTAATSVSTSVMRLNSRLRETAGNVIPGRFPRFSMFAGRAGG